MFIVGFDFTKSDQLVIDKLQLQFPNHKILLKKLDKKKYNFDGVKMSNRFPSIVWSRIDLPNIFPKIKKNKEYFCSGLMVMNLELMQKTKFVRKNFDIVRKAELYDWEYPDQNLLNFTAKGKVVLLSPFAQYIPNLDRNKDVKKTNGSRSKGKIS
ncbi:MAG: hypothetical protein JJV93_03010 [Alphaproteobacteria bacterium]|nr:hypothetical protein [Alphaproteobacteria bacterium]